MDLEHLLTLFLTLGILSTIVERIANTVLFLSVVRRYRAQQDAYQGQYHFEMVMWFASLFVGILVAFLMGIDVLQMIYTPDPATWIGGQTPGLWAGIVSGTAISFGSKIWHDLADQVYYLKKVVKKTDRSKPGNSPGPAGSLSLELVRQAVNEHGEAWMKAYGAIGVSAQAKRINGLTVEEPCVCFEVEEKNFKLTRLAQGIRKIPQKLEYRASDGVVHYLSTDVEEVSATEVAAYTHGQPKVTMDSIQIKQPGSSISRKTSPITGTLGIVVQKKQSSVVKDYILGCYHVLCHPELSKGNTEWPGQGQSVKAEIISPSMEDQGGKILGKVTEGLLTDYFDLALAELTDPALVEQQIFQMHRAPTGIRATLTDQHLGEHYPVFMTGRTSNQQRGHIVAIGASQKVNYSAVGGQTRNLKGLIKVTRIAMAGDSGACVVDQEGRAIGIVVASNSQYAYLIPIEEALYKMGVTIKKA